MWHVVDVNGCPIYDNFKDGNDSPVVFKDLDRAMQHAEFLNTPEICEHGITAGHCDHCRAPSTNKERLKSNTKKLRGHILQRLHATTYSRKNIRSVDKAPRKTS